METLNSFRGGGTDIFMYCSFQYVHYVENPPCYVKTQFSELKLGYYTLLWYSILHRTLYVHDIAILFIANINIIFIIHTWCSCITPEGYNSYGGPGGHAMRRYLSADGDVTIDDDDVTVDDDDVTVDVSDVINGRR